MKWVKVRAHSQLYAVASQNFKRVFLEMTFFPELRNRF